MFTDDFPLLQKMTLLTNEKLCSLRDYPRDWGSLPYLDYGEGVLCGCSIVVVEDRLRVEPGVVRHAGHQYFLRDAIELPYEHSDEWRLLKIRFAEPEVRGDFLRYESGVLIDDSETVKPNEMELCRFKLKRGARLRQEYQDFEDMATEYDTVNLICAPCAARGASSLRMEVLRFFAGEALRYHIVHPMDAAFCLNCLGGEPVARESILYYIAQRLRREYRDYTNMELHRLLCELLGLIKKEGPCARHRREAGRKITVD